MIQNERQYRITQTKLREFEQELAALNPQDQVLGRDYRCGSLFSQ